MELANIDKANFLDPKSQIIQPINDRLLTRPFRKLDKIDQETCEEARGDSFHPQK